MAAMAGDLPGFASLAGDFGTDTDATQDVALPFAVMVGGVPYGTLTLSTNGWMELGGNTAGDADPSNDCLPSAAHTHPLIALYWDQLNTRATKLLTGSV